MTNIAPSHLIFSTASFSDAMRQTLLQNGWVLFAENDEKVMFQSTQHSTPYSTREDFMKAVEGSNNNQEMNNG